MDFQLEDCQYASASSVSYPSHACVASSVSRGPSGALRGAARPAGAPISEQRRIAETFEEGLNRSAHAARRRRRRQHAVPLGQAHLAARPRESVDHVAVGPGPSDRTLPRALVRTQVNTSCASSSPSRSCRRSAPSATRTSRNATSSRSQASPVRGTTRARTAGMWDDWKCDGVAKKDGMPCLCKKHTSCEEEY